MTPAREKDVGERAGRCAATSHRLYPPTLRPELAVNRLPVRVIGAFLLTLSLTVGSCQTFVGALPHSTDTPAALDQRDIARDSGSSP